MNEKFRKELEILENNRNLGNEMINKIKLKKLSGHHHQ
jgi:hypothetical protein